MPMQAELANGLLFFPFNGQGNAHAAADAEGGDAAAEVVVFHVVEEGDEDAGAAGADGVAEGDGSATRVELGGVEVELFGAAEGLDGEGFVDFDGVHFVESPAGEGAEFADGTDGAEAHEGGIAADGGAGDDAGARCEAVTGDGVCAGEEGKGCAVIDAGGIASGDGAVFPEGGLQFGEGVGGGVGTRMLVFGEVASGDDLAGQGCAAGGDAALAEGGEGILLGAGDGVLVGDAFGGFAHADFEEGVGEAIDKHGILEGGVAELFAEAEIGGVVGGAAHGLDAAGEDEVVFAGADGVGGEGDGFEGGAAGHVDGVGGDFLRDAEAEADLAGDIHACACLEDLSEDDLLDVRAEGLRKHGVPEGVAELGGGEVFEAAAETADGGTTGVDDVNGGHGKNVMYRFNHELLSIRFQINQPSRVGDSGYP